MSSENPFGAVNQQERPGFKQWVVGFVDGEGCFSISVVCNETMRLGWQAQHEFVVSQAAPSREALELLRDFFGCGYVYESERHDNHRWPLARFVVRRRDDLSRSIIPFFEEHPLVTAKRNDFDRFARIISMMREGRHLDLDGVSTIASMTEGMNRRARSRFLESSEAIRQHTHHRR